LAFFVLKKSLTVSHGGGALRRFNSNAGFAGGRNNVSKNSFHSTKCKTGCFRWSLPETKDYNGQTYWLSINLHFLLFCRSKMAEFGLGWSGGMLKIQYDTTNSKKTRQFY
jgi:hypothetical protein